MYKWLTTVCPTPSLNPDLDACLKIGLNASANASLYANLSLYPNVSLSASLHVRVVASVCKFIFACMHVCGCASRA